MRRLFVSFMTVVGMVFSVVFITSTESFGTHTDPNVIHACVDKSGSVLIVSDPNQCDPKKETTIDLQKAGAEDTCPADMVEVGDFCIDKYEAQVVDSNGNPLGTSSDNYLCSDNGNDCSDPSQPSKMIFARSVTGVTPSAIITWFQAQQACANVGKRLPWNAEWQMAAAGTPDPGTDNQATDCNISGGSPFAVTATGSRSNCVSNFGAFDMVGNLFEWVADWIQHNADIDGGSFSTALYGMDGIFGIDEASAFADRFPAALVRGGYFEHGPVAGVFALLADHAPSHSNNNFGFRCARNR